MRVVSYITLINVVTNLLLLTVAVSRSFELWKRGLPVCLIGSYDNYK